MPNLRTERLHIDFLTDADAPFMLQLLNTPTWLTFIGDRGVTSLDQARDYLEKGQLASYKQHGYGLYRVALLDDTPIGLCGLVCRAGLIYPDLGFAILPEHAGRGYTTEAARRIISYARADLGITELSAITTLANIASRNTLEKLGFVYVRDVSLPAGNTLFRLYALPQ